MNKSSRKIILFALCFNMVSLFLFSTPDVKAVTAEIDTPYVFHLPISMQDQGYIPIWLWTDWANTTFVVRNIMPTHYNSTPINTLTLHRVQIVNVSISDPELITSFTLEMLNWSTLNNSLPRPWGCIFDYEIASDYPPTMCNDTGYNNTFTDYMLFEDVLVGDLQTWGTCFCFRINLNATRNYPFSITITMIHRFTITYSSDGLSEFTSTILPVIPLLSLFIVILWAFGVRYGLLGGGLGCILIGIIYLVSGEESYLLTFFSFGLSVLFFLAAYKKNERNVVE